MSQAKSKNKNRGFSLIELIIVLFIIVLLATFSVPQVNLWAAQNRARRSIAHLIADFSRARTLAAGSATVKADEMITRRPVTAIHFESTESYRIVQRLGTGLTAWGTGNDAIIRRTQLQNNITFEKVNGNDIGSNTTVIFTASGQLKDTTRNLITSVSSENTNRCDGEDNPLKDIRVFQVILRARISDAASMYFYVDFGPGGEHFVCVAGDDMDFDEGGRKIDV